MDIQSLKDAAGKSLLKKIGEGTVAPADLIKILGLDPAGQVQFEASPAAPQQLVIRISDD